MLIRSNSCYGPDYVLHEDVIDFFQTAILYYLGLPTYQWLAEKGITPSNSTKYSLGNIQGALTAAYGTLTLCEPPFFTF
jgi:ribonuclease T2